jgi:hypothetical protein
MFSMYNSMPISAAWFAFYNAHQIIEAAIKESNVIFKMHPLKMRFPGGIALQEQFALFVANLSASHRVAEPAGMPQHPGLTTP